MPVKEDDSLENVEVYAFIQKGINGVPPDRHGLHLTGDPADAPRPIPARQARSLQQAGYSYWALSALAYDDFPAVLIHIYYEGPMPDDRERDAINKVVQNLTGQWLFENKSDTPPPEENRDDDPDLGPCCACAKIGPDVRNIMMLHRLSPIPGKGWGCLQCGLPLDYAVAVLCDACLEGPFGTGPVEIKFICTGYPASDGRTPIADAPEVKIKHNPLYHPEMIQEMKWFDDSPDYGWPECVCSICGDPIPDPDDEMDSTAAERFIPLRLYRTPSREHPRGQEARFCMDCVPAVLKFMKIT